MSEYDPEVSEMDKLRMALGLKGEDIVQDAITRTEHEVDEEARARGMTPQELLAERMNQTIFRREADE
jgi:hypothetical protein